MVVENEGWLRDRLVDGGGLERKKYSLRQSGTRLARAGLWHA